MSIRVFLTGAGGLVGRNILEHPATRDWEVSAPLRRELDLRDPVAVDRHIAAFRPDIVVHAAGRVGGIVANMADPIDFLVENVDLGRNIIMSSLNNGVQQFLNLASSCMYPAAAASPLREDMILAGPLEPTNEGYALAKVFAQRLCAYISRTGAGRYRTLVPCNLFGRHDTFRGDKAHLVGAVIGKIHDAKATGSESVEIWGDGTTRREFMYAGDLADAVATAIDRFDDLPDVMNIGMGRDHSVLEYYQAAAEVIGWEGHFTFDTGRPAGMRQKLVDITRQSEWGWEPPTSLQDGIARSYEFFLNGAAR